MKQYLDLLAHVMKTGTDRGDRTGTAHVPCLDTRCVSTSSQGFPVLTTKKLHLRSIIHELLWFLKGDTILPISRRTAVSSGMSGPMRMAIFGPVYGAQWRSWPAPDGRHIRPDRASARMPEDQPEFAPPHRFGEPALVDDMALPPCHCLFQFYVSDGNCSCLLYQRSADIFLGVPFNIASYALLTLMVAQVTGLNRAISFIRSAMRISSPTISSRRVADAAEAKLCPHAPQPPMSKICSTSGLKISRWKLRGRRSIKHDCGMMQPRITSHRRCG